MISVQFNLSAISERINEIKLAWISWTYLFKFNTSKNAFFKRNQLHFSKLLQAYFLNWVSFKVHIFWEGHKFLRNFHPSFVLCSNGQISGGDFAKFCGFLRIYELYSILWNLWSTKFKVCEIPPATKILVENDRSRLNVVFSCLIACICSQIL